MKQDEIDKVVREAQIKLLKWCFENKLDFSIKAEEDGDIEGLIDEMNEENKKQ